MNFAHKNTDSLLIRSLLTFKSRDLIVMMNPFHELVASDLDFMREHTMEEVLQQATPIAHLLPFRSKVDIGPVMSSAMV